LAETTKPTSSVAGAAVESRRALPAVAFRCAPCLAFWAAAVVCLVGGIPFFDLQADTSVLVLIVAAYCVQGFAMDLPGVRVDGGAVRAPLRPWPEIPVVVLGRCKMPLESIERIVVAGRMGPLALAGIRTRTRTSCGLVFASKPARRAFYRRIAEMRPSIPIVKTT